MRSLTKTTMLVAVLALFLAASGAAVGGKPVIGPPKTVPGKAVAGKAFSVSFKVTRNGTPLRTGRMICDPAVSGKVIPHAESFRAGTAKLAFTIPKTAANTQLRVKVTILRRQIGNKDGVLFRCTAATRVAVDQQCQGDGGIKRHDAAQLPAHARRRLPAAGQR